MKRQQIRIRPAAALLAAFAALGAIPSWAERMEPLPAQLEGVTITEHLNAKIPLELEFKDENGKTIRLGDYFKPGRPVLLTLNYYGCPMLCGLQLNGLLDAMRELDWLPGKEFEVVTVSFDPGETPILAKNKKQNYIREYGRPEAAPGWHFLTGREKEIRALTEAVGFGYRYDEENDEYQHAAALFILTPQGVLSRYLYGVMYEPGTLRLSLVEAGQGKIGSAMDQIILFCFHYDAAEGRYAFAALNVMRVTALLTALILAAVMLKFWRRELARGIPTVEGHQT
ncbi:MAG: SCO family protein [Candidatus Omnitrophica bacterium]|nr:hypothetical protein [bacterium]NUN94770.1 SCO family protein [Candidatus Omnitrophota bacterium]